MIYREIRQEEYDLLKDFLYDAIYVPEGALLPPKDIINKVELRVYYEDFANGKADYCIVAENEEGVIGAVWTRIMNDYGHIDDDTPSLAISVKERYRRQGIGKKLMKEISIC